MKWHPLSKGQTDSRARRVRNLGHLLQRDLEQHIEHRMIYGDRRNAELEEWESDYLRALIEDAATWRGTREVLTNRLNKRNLLRVRA